MSGANFCNFQYRDQFFKKRLTVSFDAVQPINKFDAIKSNRPNFEDYAANFFEEFLTVESSIHGNITFRRIDIFRELRCRLLTDNISSTNA